MRAFVKIIGIAVGLTGLLGGALMSMGHLRGAEGGYRDLEMAKLKNLASNWETQLVSVRSSFRDLLLRHGVTAAVEHPSDWASWRVKNKFAMMMDDWPSGLVKPRGWALLRSNGDAHAIYGDSAGLALALDDFARPSSPDILLSAKHGPGRSLALQYAPPADQQNPTPGRLVALVNPNELFKVQSDPPAQWVLMNGPTETFLASAHRTDPPIGAGTWGILLSQSAGLVTMEDGLPLAFARIHVPGMEPLLLVSEINPPTSAGSAVGALLLLTAGTAMLVFVLKPRRKSDAMPADKGQLSEQPEPDEHKSTRETTTFRQIFQAVRTPMCVVDEKGRVLRVNSAARGLLHLPKGGQPDDTVTVIGADFRGSLKEFLVKAAAKDFAGGSWLLCFDDKHFFDGEINATALISKSDGIGPVALEFIKHQDVSSRDSIDFSQSTSPVDVLNPQPVLLVNREGRVVEYNGAALDISAKLTDSPFLYEVLPGLDESDQAAAIDPNRTRKIESLFGSRMFEFLPVATPNGILFYGVKKADSQSLQVALHQAQENFNTLSALSNEAILLVDPRTHHILETNLAASDLFGAVHLGLVDKQMDEYADWPWNEDNLCTSVQLLRCDGQCVPCSFEHVLIKVEGEPTLLVVLSSQYDTEHRNAHELADYAQSVADQLNGSAPPESTPQVQSAIPSGPGMLVVTNPIVRDVARKMLERLGHPCEVFTNLDDATVYLVRSDVRPEFVMIDMSDFDQPGDWIEMVRTRCGSVPCVGLSDSQGEELPDGPNAILPKPFELEDIANSLQSLDLDSVVG